MPTSLQIATQHMGHKAHIISRSRIHHRQFLSWRCMVNRDRHDITFEILKKASGGKKKTEMMRDVGLSYLQAKQYLAKLVGNGLLVIDQKHNYRTTKKGLELLEKCADCPLFKWDLEKTRSS